MNFITGIQATGSALNAEKVRMDIVAQNIANSHTTRDVDGNPYKRKVVSFESVLGSAPGTSGGVRVSGITSDNRDGETIYNPRRQGRRGAHAKRQSRH
jgi:flagellar basal-body rod protein FlgC